MTTPDVEQARRNLDRLLERREKALEGAGRPPDPMVIRQAEIALQMAEEHARVCAEK